MNIEYYKKSVYGKEYLYIKDKKLAETIARLTGQKTLSEEAMKSLEALDCKFKQVLPE